jgi:hypothetical protein
MILKSNVPIHDYEDLRPYIDRVVKGEENVLWPGKPKYLAKTSGTTSGVKYIPISKESMPQHIKAARNALLAYIHETGNADFVDGKMIFLQGSPVLAEKNGVSTGRLSGIVAHHVPATCKKTGCPVTRPIALKTGSKRLMPLLTKLLTRICASSAASRPGARCISTGSRLRLAAKR